jgi:hypothetical protein
MSANPPPSTAVAQPVLAGGSRFNAAARGVPMGNGWTWFASAWSMFRAAAGTWIGMLLALFVLAIVVYLVPFIGPLVMTVLWPVFIAGLMLAARSLEQRSEPKFSQLFAGFQARFGPLVLLGVVSLVISVAIIFAVVIVTGVQISTMPDPDALFVTKQLLLAILLISALLLPLVMATWFAPTLIALHDMGVGAAMKASFAGCLKNVLPFLLYGVITLVASAIASVPLGLGWLVLLPLLFLSVYTAYRDIYFD